MARTRPLDPVEIRVLGALLEKEQQTPDHYPLTVNAVISACNQKTNRDPVTQLTETEVVEALDRLRRDVITWRVEGARVERWKHSIDRRWELDRPRKALITLLLLRGPQTPGELKTRSERSHHFADKEEVESALQEMSRGIDALVRELPRAPGQRDARWIHLVGDDSAEPMPTPTTPEDQPRTAPSAPDATSLSPLEQTVASLSGEVEQLKRELHELRIRLGDLDPG